MTNPTVAEIEQALQKTLTKLKASVDPDIRRTLLAEMSLLITELDRRVLKSIESYSARPPEKK
jgi:hypothetical protein